MGLIKISGYGIPLSYHSGRPEFDPYPKTQQQSEQNGVNKGILDVALDAPDVMDDAENRGNVHQLMEQLPAFSAETGDPFLCGCNGEWNHQDECCESNRDKWSLNDVFYNFMDIKKHIEPEIRDEVQGAIEKRE